MRFLHAYANSAVCSATRTGLITGRYQYRYPIGLEEPLNRRDVGLPPDVPTLPSLLKKAGYSTALIGKWHLGKPPKYGPQKSGYDRFYGIRHGRVGLLRPRGVAVGRARRRTTRATSPTCSRDRAVSTVERLARAGAPFPHQPAFQCAALAVGGTRGHRGSAARDRTRAGAIVHYDGGSLATYAQMVLAMDAAIGRVLTALERAGVAENTIVIFTSDNGGERFSDTWPFSGKKTELLEGGMRIPAIVRWPGRVRANTTSNQTIMSMDWLPTFLAAAGVRPIRRHRPTGSNLLPQLGGAAPVSRKLLLALQAQFQEAMRDGDWKYLKILDNNFLFNVVDDPLERANLKERRRDLYDRLAAEWRAWNATMLPLDPMSSTGGFGSNELADHMGAPLRVRTPPPGAASR